MDRKETLQSAPDQHLREKLVNGARKRFFVQGFRNVTMDDLASELGMSKRTFYGLFRSKRALLEAVLEQKFLQIEADLRKVADETRLQVREQLTDLIATVQRHAQELHPPILRDLQRKAPDLFEQLHHRRSELVGRFFGTVLREGQSAGVIRAELSVELLIQILLGAIQRALDPSTMQKLRLGPHEVFSAVMGILMDGAATPSGGAP